MTTSNFIKPTFLTEFNKEIQLYGEIDVESNNNYNELIRLINTAT